MGLDRLGCGKLVGKRVELAAVVDANADPSTALLTKASATSLRMTGFGRVRAKGQEQKQIQGFFAPLRMTAVGGDSSLRSE